MYRLALALALGGALSGCATTPHRPRPTGIVEQSTSTWRGKAEVADAGAIDAMAARWAAARARASKAGPRAARAIAAEGALLAGPALDHPAPSPGPYRCRLVRIGSAAGRAGLRGYAPTACFVGGDPGNQLSFSKPGGDAPSGWLFPDDVTTRYVFLGARQHRTGGGGLAYGSDPARNLAGVFERVGNFRWRLVIAGAAPDTLDVYDLTPIAGPPAK
ncbi:MAG: DUF4893 domain-containing protein [Sphingomonas sp.]|jgi:hypothetical protein|uniref:DUF4893 domain-containing protein n=1 Tax=Sphingomonas sp. TaxID=28214 RepID=UPI0035674A6D